MNKKRKTKITLIYAEDIAKRFHDKRYYEAMGYNLKHLLHIENEKFRLRTGKCFRVTALINKYKELGANKIRQINVTLREIALRNVHARFKGEAPPVHTNIMPLVTSVPFLIQAYQKIRSNKGAMTLGASLRQTDWNKLNFKQRHFIRGVVKNPDGIALEHFFQVSHLLRKGLYPWGTSRRIYIPKPGVPDKKRPITIPPFFDRIVQQCIKTILEVIYEPWFDKDNCSFGLRPKKGTHNAIISLISRGSQNLQYAIEGDTEQAYDRVNKDKLVNFIGKRINDRKFLNFLKKRLNYTFFDEQEKDYVTPIDGVPQGGIDSPYLFNIYLKQFDEWILAHLEKKAIELNKKTRVNRTRGATEQYLNPSSLPAIKEKSIIRKRIKELKQKITNFCNPKEKYKYLKIIRILKHKVRRLPGFDRARTFYRFRYVRYVDDWIIITNAGLMICEQIKQEIANWLWNNLDAKLSQTKTLITDMKKQEAHFLGFEFRCLLTRKFAMKRNARTNTLILSKVAGSEIKIGPDRQRLINRLHMKGYCDKHGRPITIPWLSCMEPSVIIQKFASVIQGLCDFYAEFITNKNAISRWIYIIRFSCIKTLAQKYKTSTRKIFKRFSHKDPYFRKIYGKTLNVKLRIIYKYGHQYEKSYILPTYLSALDKSIKLKLYKKYSDLHAKLEDSGGFLTLEKYLDIYEKKGNYPFPLDKDYLAQITWVNWRTSCSFELPCSICGKPGPNQMHHIKHVRKRKYELIPPTNKWEKMMGLRNRKQIPVCFDCHINLIHRGNYSGPSLKTLLPTLHDNRIVNIENYVNPSKIEYHSKDILARGFVRVF